MDNRMMIRVPGMSSSQLGESDIVTSCPVWPDPI